MLRRSQRRWLPLAMVLSALGCGLSTEETDPEVASRVTEALGEPTNGFPSADERLMLMAINRGRSDPSTIKGAQSTVYPARPPVLWDYNLSRSSRFHATNLLSADVTLMHTSPCALNTNVGTSGCDGTVACACASPVPTTCAACADQPAVNTCGTAPFTRIGFFSSIATGEVAAAGFTDTFASVTSWLDEPAGADGHRMNLLDQGIVSNVMGAGHTAGTACFSTFDISDSGMMAGLTIPQLPTASVQPVSGHAGATFTFYATWADVTGGAPRTFNVVVDGRCVALAQELGTPTLNSTWSAAQTLTAGCHNYYYVATDSRGNTVQYPTIGSLNVAADSTCPSDYQATAPAATCNPSDGGAAGGGTLDASVSHDAGGAIADASAGHDAAGPGIGSDASAAVRDAASASEDDAAATSKDAEAAAVDARVLFDGQAASDARADLPDGAQEPEDSSTGSGAGPVGGATSGTPGASGCGCHAVPAPPAPLGGVSLLVALVALRRRKSTLL